MIQLNRRFGFLQQSQVCVDLCAAPGGWMQVAKQNMPVSSIVIGVDLYPIKPIPGCIALVEDITTDKCKTSLSRELQTWKVDVVLHDGAPNVGKNWLFDAYQQVCLTLNALKLASGFLRSGGWFITKVFRSKDYNALLWVLKQLFKKVHATKPSASRKESAEIFVVCQFYLAPDKIDPKFFDSKYVFEELDLENPKQFSLLQQNDKKRIKAVGYTEKEFSMRNELNVSEFIAAENGLNELQGVSVIVFDSEVIKNHPKTTDEIKECCKDIKVLSRKDIRNLLAWWKVLHEQMYPKEKISDVVEDAPKKPLTKDEEDDLEVDEMEKHIADMELEELKEAKRKKKKTAKTRSKLNEKLNLKMVLKYDEGPREEADDMFDVSGMDQNDLDALDDQNPDTVLDSDTEIDAFKPKFKRYDKDDKIYLDDDGRYEDNDGEAEETDNELEMESDLEVKTGLGLDDSDEDVKVSKKKKGKNALINDLDYRDKDSKRRQRVQLWFDKDTIKEADKDENEDLDLDTLAAEYKSKGVKVLGTEERQPKIEIPLGKKARRRARHEDNKKDSSSEESSSDEEDVVKSETAAKKPIYKLTEEELALGALMVSSKKVKRDLIDAAWNRYAFNDDNLPDWFVRDEKLHMQKEAPVPKELVDQYSKRLEEFNVRPIKKVMEAKARKKRRTMKRLEKAKKKAENILENTDASSQEKIRQLKKLYRKAEDKKQEVTYVVAKRHTASKRVKRPAGVKGRFKVVDPRLKKDTRAKKVIQKKMKKRK